MWKPEEIVIIIACIAVILGSIVIGEAVLVPHAFAEPSIPIMSHDQRQNLFNQVPNFQGSNINYFFQIIITPTGVQENNVILDQKNYTAIKNNVGFFTACGGFNNGLCQPPVITASSPTSNYCPIAKMILVNQDGYLNKTYTIAPNGTLIKDLTDFIYPSYCYSETGANPINGHDNPPSVPEFGPVAGFVLIIAVISIIALRFKSKDIPYGV